MVFQNLSFKTHYYKEEKLLVTILVNEQLFYLEVKMDEIRNNNEELEMTDAMLRQQDLIDNATYDVCCSYLGIPDEERENLFPWNMQILAQVREGITDALLQFGKPVCYPYIEHDEAGSRYCNQKDCYCENCVRDSESIQILSYNFYEFEDYPLYFIKIRLDKDERVRLLQQFDLWYAGTDQETKQYALEFAVIVRMLLDDAIVLNPKYLALGEVLDEMLSLIPDSKRKLYHEHFLKIQDGYTPATKE